MLDAPKVFDCIFNNLVQICLRILFNDENEPDSMYTIINVYACFILRRRMYVAYPTTRLKRVVFSLKYRLYFWKRNEELLS